METSTTDPMETSFPSRTLLLDAICTRIRNVNMPWSRRNAHLYCYLNAYTGNRHAELRIPRDTLLHWVWTMRLHIVPSLFPWLFQPWLWLWGLRADAVSLRRWGLLLKMQAPRRNQPSTFHHELRHSNTFAKNAGSPQGKEPDTAASATYVCMSTIITAFSLANVWEATITADSRCFFAWSSRRWSMASLLRLWLSAISNRRTNDVYDG